MKAFILKASVLSSPSLNIANYQMRHFENDTTAAIATAISGSSALIHFAQTWQPVVSLCVGLVGIVSGLFAIRYYHGKTNK